jgi:hypothetical protein
VGGAGADSFQYNTVGDSTATATDFVQDFSQTQGDKVRLSPIDPDLSLARDQAFAFIGTAAFSGGGAAQVRYYQSGGNTYVEADTGDGNADLVVRLGGSLTLAATDFVL